MAEYTNTRLWQTSLAPQPGDPEQGGPRERLRSVFLNFRERAAQIAGEISRDLPEFTVHNITHLDALWEMATLIAGDDIVLTPTEAFVLGGAFLIHDLGMGLAAFPDGREALKRDPSWNDIVTAQLKKKLGRVPIEAERNNPEKEVETDVITELLRLRHARQAEELAVAEYKDITGRETYHFIEDPELRKAFGPVIGQIAHSHWWSIDEVRQRFANYPSVGPPAVMNCPGEWTVDRLKLACLMRTADAIHIDGRRAPGFLRALRKPGAYANLHWTFQQNITIPRREGERIIFTSCHSFTAEESPAWWIGYELLQTADRELRNVDILLQDLEQGYRFAARSVAGVEEPERLRRHIPTQDWVPVDARIKVSNVAALVQNLGGDNLYNNNKTVPLRELIQNASDAVRARRLLENRSGNWGDVGVKTGKDAHGLWIEVDDFGVGMSSYVLTGPFLDFGQSFWDTPKMHEELPGLQGKGFISTGKYGIGFFSVFMWGHKVRVITRRYEAARSDTNVLEFTDGVKLRPLLRKANSSEQRAEGGTSIRVWLNEPLFVVRGEEEQGIQPGVLEQLCSQLCPAIDVNIYVGQTDNSSKQVIAASGWLSIDGELLLRRIWADRAVNIRANPEEIQAVANSLRVLYSSSGEPVGRACIFGTLMLSYANLYTGCVVSDGFYVSGLSGIAGLLFGSTTGAVRDVAVPIVESEILADWATEQARLVGTISQPKWLLEDCAAIVRGCGGRVGDLPIARRGSEWINFDDLANWQFIPDEVTVLLHEKRQQWEALNGMVINQNVISARTSFAYLVYNSVMQPLHWTPQSQLFNTHPLKFHSMTLLGVVIEALAVAWQSSAAEVYQSSSFSGSISERIERPIGIYNGQPVNDEVAIFRKPSSVFTG